MQKVAIYLAGSIQKSHESGNELYWTKTHLEQIRESLAPYDVSFLNPAFRTDDLSDQRSVFGRDMTQVFCSDFVFVDARDRRGLGVGAEMMWAKFHNIPVVTWSPCESHYNKKACSILGVPVENFIHPFVEGLSDKIVSDPTEGALWMKESLLDSSFKPKGIESIISAMNYYKDEQLDKDHPMKEMIEANDTLRSRINTLQVETLDVR